MTELINMSPTIAKSNLSNLKKLSTPSLLSLLEAKTWEGKEVAPDPEFAKLVEYVLSTRKEWNGKR
jgi:hypothetical protein